MAKRPPFKKVNKKDTTTKKDAPPFLTADDLRGITKFRIEPSISLYQRQNGSTALFMTVMRQDKHVFTWSMNCNGPDRISMQQKCGRNVLDWPGKVIELHPVEGSRGGRFVNFYDPERLQQQAQRRSSVPISDDDIPF